MSQFKNRVEAGKQLAPLLKQYAAQHPLILGLPRGGVPVAYEVARALGAPLDVWIVRKIGVPWHPEVGVGAVVEGGFTYLNRDILNNIQLSEADIADAVELKRREVAERVELFRGDRGRPSLRGRTVIVVDDGIATGGTVHATLTSIRAEGPKTVVLAVPVVAADVARVLKQEVDHLVSLRTPRDLYAIGLWYEDFTQVSDDEVLRLLARAGHELGDAGVASMTT